jgi:3D-(3,5/4)-trihydroxycyclohexane-1,2-dione acylhydrolase (decyclizing)
VDRIFARRVGPPISQGEVIGLLNSLLGPRDVIVCAAGSLPGDLHKLWRARDPKQYHLEYGYSCMGYEIAGGLGVKMADPSREVYVLVGDGSYLMMSQEIATAIQEGTKINIVLLDNHGFSSIGGLSRACGSGGFGTEYRYRTDGLKGKIQAIDFVANAASLGARAQRATTREELAQSIENCKQGNGVSVIVVETDYHDRVPGYESWWDVAVAEVSSSEPVEQAYRDYAAGKKRERYLWPGR